MNIVETVVDLEDRLAKEFEKLVRGNPKFEVTREVILGLVCFRMKVYMLLKNTT